MSILYFAFIIDLRKIFSVLLVLEFSWKLSTLCDRNSYDYLMQFFLLSKQGAIMQALWQQWRPARPLMSFFHECENSWLFHVFETMNAIYLDVTSQQNKIKMLLIFLFSLLSTLFMAEKGPEPPQTKPFKILFRNITSDLWLRQETLIDCNILIFLHFYFLIHKLKPFSFWTCLGGGRNLVF